MLFGVPKHCTVASRNSSQLSATTRQPTGSMDDGEEEAITVPIRRRGRVGLVTGNGMDGAHWPKAFFLLHKALSPAAALARCPLRAARHPIPGRLTFSRLSLNA